MLGGRLSMAYPILFRSFCTISIFFSKCFFQNHVKKKNPYYSFILLFLPMFSPYVEEPFPNTPYDPLLTLLYSLRSLSPLSPESRSHHCPPSSLLRRCLYVGTGQEAQSTMVNTIEQPYHSTDILTMVADLWLDVIYSHVFSHTAFCSILQFLIQG